jgi:predicted nucleic-acid-binding protein
VLVEVVQVLSSKVLYPLPRTQVRSHLLTVLRLRGLKLPGKRQYRRALDLYVERNVDFVDALIVAQMEARGITTLPSFDRDFDHFPSVTREEPT